ncbi:TPA: hypothetical protein ACX6RQ_003398 [Photobacterium damselae]|uniref:hypothetical protein n=1 Tax=Photobacterium damselae TaxID=38293 RepID=UPI001F46AECA|nr:hypothetical protein [Photobacterium damselae]UKA31878.1 hypothetical protein IPQ37_20925 [Photobacterium damselae subsp. damselae]
MKNRKYGLLALTFFPFLVNASIWPFQSEEETTLNQVCPNCALVAKDIQMLQEKTCPDGLTPGAVMDIAQSKQFYPMLLALKNNTSDETYHAVLEKLKANMDCSDWNTAEKAKSAFDSLSKGVDNLLNTWRE